MVSCWVYAEIMHNMHGNIPYMLDRWADPVVPVGPSPRDTEWSGINDT